MIDVNTTYRTDEVTITITDGRRYRKERMALASRDDWTLAELAAIASEYATSDMSLAADYMWLSDGEQDTGLYPATQGTGRVAGPEGP